MEVHLCPAVPTQANTHALRAKSRSPSFITMQALLPPNSRIVLPNLLWTVSLILFPTPVEPVNEIS